MVCSNSYELGTCQANILTPVQAILNASFVNPNVSLFSRAFSLSQVANQNNKQQNPSLSLFLSLSQYFNFKLQNKNQTLFLSQSSVSLRLPTTTGFGHQSHLFVSPSILLIRNGNGSGSGWVIPYPDPTHGSRLAARTQLVY